MKFVDAEKKRGVHPFCPWRWKIGRIPSRLVHIVGGPRLRAYVALDGIV